MPRGGRRPGAGRPKGSKEPQTLAKEEGRRLLRETVIANLLPLIESQVANAKGIKYLVVREKATGKFVRVGEAIARLKVGKGEEVIEVWEKDPSVQAFAELVNHALDKAPQHVDVDADHEVRMRWQVGDEADG